jgi:hypothetical protein
MNTTESHSEQKCSKEGCKFKKSTFNAYCGKHQRDFFIKETKDSGRKCCANVIRGCKQTLDLDYGKTKCETCLEKDRLRDKLRRNPETKSKNDKVTGDAEQMKKHCSSCGIYREIDFFIGVRGNPVKTCRVCREANARADNKRKYESQ